MKKLSNKIAIYIGILVILVGLGVWASVALQTETKAPTVSDEQRAPERSRTVINYEAKAGMTSLEQLKAEADSVVTKDSDFGTYVESIEGHVGGTDGKYWSFYVDGEMSEVGAADYQQEGGEEILWKFQKL